MESGVDHKLKKQVEHKSKNSISADEEVGDDGVSNTSASTRDGGDSARRAKKDRERELFRSSGKSLVRG